MTEYKFLAPPVLSAKYESEPSVRANADAPSGIVGPSHLVPGNKALFTAASMRHEMVNAYPELDQLCTQLEFDRYKSIGEWSANPTATLLIFARAAQPPSSRPTFDWSQAEISELITDLINHHHCPLRNELRRLGLLIRNIDLVHPEARVFDLDAAYSQLEINLILHMDHEEMTIFPHCLTNEARCLGSAHEKIGPAEVTSGIREMMLGHDYGAEELAYLLTFIDAAAPTVSDSDFAVIRLGLHAMADDLSMHADKERDILMPAAIFSEDLLRSKQYHAAQQRGN